MTEGKKAKIGYGDRTRVEQAIADSKIDGGDIVFTTDAELAFIKEDNIPMYIKPKIGVFDTIEAAEIYLNDNPYTYVGQNVSIKDSDGKYRSYTVQDNAGTFVVEPSVKVEDSGFTIVEF